MGVNTWGAEDDVAVLRTVCTLGEHCIEHTCASCKGKGSGGLEEVGGVFWCYRCAGKAQLSGVLHVYVRLRPRQELTTTWKDCGKY